ncbi:MAG: glycosyltransferase family 2 protein [Candidatus Sumerlaeaceae bacterium]|nr:glycosyltransferase family 2 protein [Candidatus Sumerlaeaceae bacterium]
MEQPAHPLASVVVITLNGSDVIRNCLDSLLPSDYPNFEVLLVNNGSTDGVEQIVRTEYPSVRIVSLGKNLGYAGGNNEGIKASRGEIVVLLNDDTVLQPTALGEVVRPFVENPQVGIVGCKILYPDGKTIQHAGARILSNGASEHIGNHEEDRGQYDEPRDVDYVIGCMMGIRRAVFHDIGLFDDRYFPIYFDEQEFAVRARRKGWRVVYNPKAVLCHIEAKTQAMNSERYLFRYHRSRLRYVLKNFPARALWGFLRGEWHNIAHTPDAVNRRVHLKAWGYTLPRLPMILIDRKWRFLKLPASHT